MKRTATITEIFTYCIEFDAPEDANDDLLDELARDEWARDTDRPHDYNVECEVEDIVSDEARSYGPRR